MKSDLVDIDVIVHHETAGAVLVSDDGDRARAVWLPKAAIEIEPVKGKSHHRVTMPERLATEKGLV
jgi:hypothetical protein